MPGPNNFSLQLGDLPSQLFASLGLRGLRRSLRSAGVSEFEFLADGSACDGNALAAEGTICTVFQGSTRFFTGRLAQVPRSGSGTAESLQYLLQDPWRDLEKITYQVQWTTLNFGALDESGNPTKATEFRSEIILGIDNLGNSMNSGQVIADVIAWAARCGANLVAGEIGVSAPIPCDEITDLPCSEVIRKMMRWTPDAVAWFNYETNPPTFNVTRRGACAQVTLGFDPAAAGAPEKVDIRALPDLVATGVVIRYLQQNKTDNIPCINTIVDDAPEGFDGAEYGCAVMTVRLAGTQATLQKNVVKTLPVPENAESSACIPFLNETLPWTTKYGDVVVSNVQQTVVAGQTDTLGNAVSGSVDDYPNMIVSGDVTADMGCTSAKNLVTVTFTYDGGKSTTQVCKVVGTNAVSKTYTRLASYTQAETVPNGMAAQLYSALSSLQYAGSYTTVQQDVTAWQLGCVLNLSGGRLEWFTMNALLQSIDDDLDAGRTTLRFGPAGHLTIQDLMEQLRANRGRVISSHIAERQTGTPGDAPQVNGPGNGNTQVSPPEPGGAQPWSDYIVDQAAGSGISATYDVLFGYGQSSFANSGGIDHASPIEKFEISVGNDGSAWTGSTYGSDADTWGLSIQSGNDDAEDDIICIGTNAGSVSITPNDPSIYLCGDINADDADDDTPNIDIDFGDMKIEMQDEDGSTITLDLSDSPVITIDNADTGNSSILDEDSLTLSASSNTITIDATVPSLEIEDSSGSSATMDSNSLALVDDGSGGSVTIDASGTSGKAISWQTVTVCVDGTQKSMLVLGSAPF